MAPKKEGLDGEVTRWTCATASLSRAPGGDSIWLARERSIRIWFGAASPGVAMIDPRRFRHALAGSMVLLVWPRASRAVCAMCRALRRAASYMADGLSWSWKRSEIGRASCRERGCQYV